MVKKSDITVIIPVHKWDKDIEKMFTEAVKSIPAEVKVIVSTTKDAKFKFEFDAKSDSDKDHFVVVKSDDGSSFQHLVNLGVKKVKTEWFSILEFDDEYSSIWFDEFIKYQEYNQQYNMFLPLNDLYSVAIPSAPARSQPVKNREWRQLQSVYSSCPASPFCCPAGFCYFT